MLYKGATSQQARHMDYYYVYIIQSLKYQKRFYTGYTTDIWKRLKAHNNGQDKYTCRFKPWKVKTVIAFTSERQARQFERYLKSPSGRAFAIKRL